MHSSMSYIVMYKAVRHSGVKYIYVMYNSFLHNSVM